MAVVWSVVATAVRFEEASSENDSVATLPNDAAVNLPLLS
jgi:hypothetical protein